MLLTLVSKKIFDLVISDDRYQNKFRSFFWRDMLLYLAATWALLLMIALIARPVHPLMLTLAALPFSAACAVVPVIHFHLWTKKKNQK